MLETRKLDCHETIVAIPVSFRINLDIFDTHALKRIRHYTFFSQTETQNIKISQYEI